MTNRNYAIIGTGAVGGFYGAKLQKAGLEVNFLLRSDYQTVKKQGLIIESPEGDFTLPQVRAYHDARKMPQCDVVIVALKTTQNHLLSKILPLLLKDNGVVLVLQNGLNAEPQIAQIVGAERVIGGLCFLCSYKIGPGHVSHLDYGTITLGEYAQDYKAIGITDRLHQIAEDFQRAEIPIEMSEDLLLSRWKKLVWNIPYNGLSVILNARTDELMANPDTLILVEEIMAEVIAAAKSCDRIIPDNFIPNMLEYTHKMKPYRTSMKIDYDESRPLEVEAIFGNPIRVAEKAGVKLPQIEVLYRMLKFVDVQRQEAERKRRLLDLS
ncbi:putative 2-dehydropantoate 2-reductase [Tychonema sp. LEGE 07199]|uniref:putative 2-dehydropantoate 2-reductase n=1 Tax=unclassified Tychonema TaxID=2642144 RepID=UPI00188177DC|nr:MULTISPECIES: putative 2-dehydropantoate 2-reductase [unclassified Tychonema]MBE9123075.1 putative 2-dehydropantoate 2-reductase [Tychonema sp. LEGE 07199]MBE9132789.1 putative 2-dehydropantoate 2-reductase [Tychonema sp. LEGE 07196]